MTGLVRVYEWVTKYVPTGNSFTKINNFCVLNERYFPTINVFFLKKGLG